MTTGLILGYGRAGRRHGKILDKLGVEWVYFDPYVDVMDALPGTGRITLGKDSTTLNDVLQEVVRGHANYDFVVICTPPALHLEQIKLCLEAGLPVLCEKPLCALGQLDEAKAIPLDSPVMVAYNYRYHPALMRVQGRAPSLMLCRQKRDDLPEWGLLLDHVSHNLDIIYWLTDGEFEIRSAQHKYKKNKEEWIVRGFVDKQRVTIKESVAGYYNTRDAMLMYPNAEAVFITPDPQMYIDMWRAFLDGNYYPGLKEAIQTQELLEVCNDKS